MNSQINSISNSDTTTYFLQHSWKYEIIVLSFTTYNSNSFVLYEFYFVSGFWLKKTTTYLLNMTYQPLY